ncbi:MotA/TolQ/ExbB proton channel family protein [Verticiella sediminum]|uniref:Biopolymer transport protein ExbB n=1 Tax=Verticiella sediminum TaxID=1247510 RepID=A0A556A923_9BURK|nr:MotA/TolQ/ExbB proton channel family protein [Verticiella sediminum]TSH89386.1 MotA/TolQ/ExbB proton channel family protein [Verticiella sediminum]
MSEPISNAVQEAPSPSAAPDAGISPAQEAPSPSAAPDAGISLPSSGGQDGLPDPAAEAQALNQSAVPMTQAPQPTDGMGFMHFIEQSDIVGKSLFVILIVMSIASWYLIVVKGFSNMAVKRRSRTFLDKFWQSSSLAAVENEIVAHGARDPFSHLAIHAIHARDHHAKFGAAKLEEAGSESDFVMRTMRKVIDEETAKVENGLTVLASVGSTAPFVGLFGTVWGVYHALVGIGMGGGATIDRIAGPVGEALIMTGLGLAVAIPAVLGFNAFVRRNRVMLSQLDAFAYDLFAVLTTGRQVANEGRVRSLRN